MKREKGKESVMRKRKRAAIYQYYRVWSELVDVRKNHMSRQRSIKAGKSSLDPHIEEIILENLHLDTWIDTYKKLMIEHSRLLAPDIHHWLTTIHGIGDKTAAALIGELDDIERFDNISKMWRFSGFAVIDGKRERNVKGQTSHFNQRLKSLVYMIGAQFVRKQTPIYIDIYYKEKARQRELHPEAYKENGKWLYNDGHLHNRAIGKMVKIFLAHVWLVWRKAEGLPITQPYVAQIMGHTGIIEPPQFEKVTQEADDIDYETEEDDDE